MYKIIKKIRSGVLVYLTHRMALPILRLVRRPELFPYTVAELQQFPPDSLGKDLVNFLQQKDLQLLPYYARHDIKHILLQYDTTDEGEVCLQCFMLGNGHLSFPVLATVFYGFCTMPEYLKKFVTAFRRGRSCVPISGWNWFAILYEPTSLLIQKLHPCEK